MLIKQFLYMEIVWLAFFLMATAKIIPSNFEIILNFLQFFSTANWTLYLDKHISKKLYAKFIFFVHNVILVSLILDFFFFSLTIFFKNAENPFFCLACMFMYALINLW